ncbi:MAG TPA: heavy metal translocating P-type ATPase [Gemmatimonadetes bacterium]|nr:heavy metal translocating P-type ATPase [Gemmatimonadota bacterium]
MGSCCNPYEDKHEERWRSGALSTSACGVLALAGWAAALLGMPQVSLALLLAAYAAGGWKAAGRAFSALRKARLDVDLLMLLAAGGAGVVGHWLEGAALLFLFSLGNTLENFAFGRTRRSIRALMELRPDEAVRVEGGEVRTVPLHALSPGNIVRVRPGERIAVDGEVIDGRSHVDESTLTGEAMPVAKELGSPVYAGALNGSGSLDIRMTSAADDTTLARVIRLVENAREARAPTQSWIEAVESRYAGGVIIASVVAVLLPWLALGWTFDDAFYRAMTLLVVASPCALVISIPASIVSAVSNGARHGILFKGGASLDALSDVRVIAFDKTGTLTVGRPELVGILTLASAAHAPAAAPAGQAPTTTWNAERALLRMVAAAESRSEHPLAGALVRAAQEREISVPEPEAFESMPGLGVEAVVEGTRVRVGRRSWVDGANGDNGFRAASHEGRSRGSTPVYVSLDGRLAAELEIADAPRRGLDHALTHLRKQGVRHFAMLTGDDRGTAEAIAAELDIDAVHAELLPDGKTEVLERLREQYGPVAMVGDGVNDAPALAVADVGIALGAVGTDVALETADVVVMGGDLDRIGHAVQLSHRTRRIVRQNLVFSVGVMVTLVVLALVGQIGLTVGVLGHEGSTIVVVFNGLRLLTDRRAG